MRNGVLFTGICLGLTAVLPAAAAASQEHTVPETYAIEVSASADDGALTIILEDALQDVDRLLITLPDASGNLWQQISDLVDAY